MGPTRAEGSPPSHHPPPPPCRIHWYQLRLIFIALLGVCTAGGGVAVAGRGNGGGGVRTVSLQLPTTYHSPHSALACSTPCRTLLTRIHTVHTFVYFPRERRHGNTPARGAGVWRRRQKCDQTLTKRALHLTCSSASASYREHSATARLLFVTQHMCMV